MRTDTPQVGYAPYRQVHAHSTGNRNSTAQNEADIELAFIKQAVLDLALVVNDLVKLIK